MRNSLPIVKSENKIPYLEKIPISAAKSARKQNILNFENSYNFTAVKYKRSQILSALKWKYYVYIQYKF